MGATCCWILSRPGYNYLSCKVQAGRQHPCRRHGRVRGCSCPDQSRYRGEVQRGSLSLANFIHHSAEAQLPLAITYESQQSAHPSPPALTLLPVLQHSWNNPRSWPMLLHPCMHWSTHTQLVWSPEACDSSNTAPGSRGSRLCGKRQLSCVSCTEVLSRHFPALSRPVLTGNQDT